METPLGALLTARPPVRLAEIDSRSTPGSPGSKADTVRALAVLAPELADLQERLYAAGRAGATERRVLLLLQGMDTSGKGGVLREVAGICDPQGIEVTAFKRPTAEELAHDFLWRVRRRLPAAGTIGFFDRSHYEDVLIGRVRGLAPSAEIERRYEAVVAFEQEFAAAGGVLVKCLLHIDADDQGRRLAERLADPAKHWKYNPGDLDERELWDQYQAAYETALDRTSTAGSPWHVVPAGRKWYRNWAVASLLLEALRGLDLGWPTATFDVAAEQARLARSRRPGGPRPAGDKAQTPANSSSSGTRSTAPTA